MQKFVVFILYGFVLVHALPGIVDGARKSSQGGSWGCGRDSSLPVLEATTSRDQHMSAVTSVVYSAVGTAQ